MPVKVGLGFCSKIVACGLLLSSLLPVSVQAEALSWKQQLGNSFSDSSSDVATDSNNNIYITGSTSGSLAGTNNAGYDAWVAKYNSSGNLVWKQQLGLFGEDVYSTAVTTDSHGNVYVSGSTTGDLAGRLDKRYGLYDAWVAKYNSSGNLVWKQQFGSSGSDFTTGAATDNNGNIYISGFTDGNVSGSNKGGFDTWVAKYNSSGERMWKRQLGTSSDDHSYDVAIDSNGNVYISGYTTGDLAGDIKGASDAFVAKYNSSGTLMWKRQLGSSDVDKSYGVATDSIGNVYISGETYGSLAAYNKAGRDAFVAKYNSTGNLVWKRQLGVYGPDGISEGQVTDSVGVTYKPGIVSEGVSTDSKGNVYISGWTNGSLAVINPVGYDAFVAKYNSAGALVWKDQLGTSYYDNSFGVATDSIGNVYISGGTDGNAFLVKYTQ